MTKEDFWKKYIKSGELERKKMLYELPFCIDKNGVCGNISLTLIQSYFDDIIEYMENLTKHNSSSKKDCYNKECAENHNNECECYFEGQPDNCKEWKRSPS